MLVKSKKAKGRALEGFVAKAFRDVFGYAYARADSGSGKFQKEDVTIPHEVPLFIEVKNQAKLSLKSWWFQTTYHCPVDKLPVLVYKLNYQKEPTAVMTAGGFFQMVKEARVEDWQDVKVAFSFSDFMEIVKCAFYKKF